MADDGPSIGTAMVGSCPVPDRLIHCPPEQTLTDTARAVLHAWCPDRRVNMLMRLQFSGEAAMAGKAAEVSLTKNEGSEPERLAGAQKVCPMPGSPRSLRSRS